jgi:toxin-antitoxin system PIN domain toxin
VIAVDTNVLVYAHREDTEWHERAASLIAELAGGAPPWAIPWPCAHEFLATVTHPRIFRTPTPVSAALDQVAAWFESPSLVLLAENDSYFGWLSELIGAGRVTGPKVHDARVAALCLTHGVRVLWSADRDFSLFPALQVRNPLIA